MEVKFTPEEWVAYLKLFAKNEAFRFENEEKARQIYEKLDKRIKKDFKLDGCLIYKKR
jgi:hypothetical protein